MESPQKMANLAIGGMTCINCQTKIEKRLLKLDGVSSAEVSWRNGTAKIEYDEEKISLEKITSEIEKLGYKVLRSGENSNSLLYVAAIAALFVILERTGVMNVLSLNAVATEKMSLVLLFVTGLLTSVHCVAMCGGINMSQSLQNRAFESKKIVRADFMPSLLYNAGRVASYTLIGFVLGAIGFFLVGGSENAELSLPFFVQGVLKIIAGVFMIFAGISLLGIFPFLRRFTPHLPAFLSKKISSAQAKHAAPFIVGFLNGFMPCGPLQAMWIVALVSGNPLSGALSMLAFSAGTVPLMLGLGSIVSVLGKKYTGVMMKAGAILVVVMGLSMMSQGFALGGFGNSGSMAQNAVSENKTQTAKTDAKSDSASASPEIVMEDGKQIVKSTLNPYRYPAITVKKGVPVHWEIEAGENALTGCNYKMLFRDLGFMYELGYGTNVIEFTPEKAGTMQYTCWMGMVRGTIRVVE